MELKKYQRRVVDEVRRFLERLAEERAGGKTRHAAMDAWEGLELGRYWERQNGLGEDLPTLCIKVPTGGGKTLLATQILGSIYQTIHRDRNGAGLVLWVVPSSQIYRDTLKRLQDRSDMYRLMLEHAVSRRIELWEKTDIVRLTPAKLRECLNILMVQLASTNRETKEQLRFFKDSGGNIVQHFPPEDDPAAHRELKRQFRNLDMVVDEESRGEHLCATSIGNLVRLSKPVVVLDEGHKATSPLALATIENFNASMVVELTATPREVRGDSIEYRPNIVSGVTGQELLDEEMIKLPLNIATSGQKSWQDVLTQARDKRDALAVKAIDCADELGQGRLIRPIVLVQVERTGQDQRGRGKIHSQDVQEYLVERLGVSPDAIRIKTADNDGLENIDLLDAGCPVTWIITKSALQEGWDCPFAYILVSLSDTQSGLAMTQLVGRILRQPYQQRTSVPELNESYVYVLHARATDVARQVKNALEKEGYEGDIEGLVIDASDREGQRNERTVAIRREFTSLYKKPFRGKIYLPHFCVKDGREYEPLDYFRHLLSQADVTAFSYGRIDWPLAEAMREAKDRFYRISLGSNLERVYETEADLLEKDEQVLAWMAASLPFEYLSHKQLNCVVRKVYDRLVASELNLEGRLALVKFVVRDHVQRFVQDEIDSQTEAAFTAMFKAKKLKFYLECAQCRFEVPSSYTVNPTRPLTHPTGELVQRSLFDYVDEQSVNNFERAVALCLDQDDANVLWWYRNLVGPEHFAIQGFKRHKIRPDFVVQSGTRERPVHRVIVIDTKGKQLEGNLDTQYKRAVADYFEKVGRKVTWQQLAADFEDHVFKFQILDETQEDGRDWKDELRNLLADRD